MPSLVNISNDVILQGCHILYIIKPPKNTCLLQALVSFTIMIVFLRKTKSRTRSNEITKKYKNACKYYLVQVTRTTHRYSYQIDAHEVKFLAKAMTNGIREAIVVLNLGVTSPTFFASQALQFLPLYVTISKSNHIFHYLQCPISMPLTHSLMWIKGYMSRLAIYS